VLVVDDTDLVRTLVTRQLKDGGYEVLEAATGKQALGILGAAEVKVSLMVTDLKMPEMNGQQLGSAVGALPVPPKILYMSAYPPPEGLSDFFLQKPFTRDHLLGAVEKALSS
jgi:two-component system cell cycle sensor histidine kinase/response regulator CckA